MSNTSTIAFAGVVLVSFLSVSALAFPAAPVNSKATLGVILAAGGCKLGFHQGPDGLCQSNETRQCPIGTHFSSRAEQCLRNCRLRSHAGLQIC
jgi:hypothetical protein